MSPPRSGRGAVSGYEIVHASREFRTLRRRLGSFAVPAAALFLGWYFLYVLTAAFAPGFMRISVFGEVNVGLCFGVLQFVSTFAITIGYRRWAQRNLDPMSHRIRHRLEAGRKQ
jgi:uncharacterized membrane protein (DUF485 family)